jgi:predicted transcriptional regulator
MPVKMIAKTIRIPEYLSDQIEQLAGVSRRSFTKQVEVMLENAIDKTVESDLKLLQTMGAVTPSSTFGN